MKFPAISQLVIDVNQANREYERAKQKQEAANLACEIAATRLARIQEKLEIALKEAM